MLAVDSVLAIKQSAASLQLLGEVPSQGPCTLEVQFVYYLLPHPR